MDSFSASSFGGSYNSNSNNSNSNSNNSNSNSNSNNISNDPVLGNSKDTIHPAMPPMPWDLSTEDPSPKQHRGDELRDESKQNDDHNENESPPLPASVKDHKRDTFLVTLEMLLLKTRQKKDRQMQQVKDSEEFEGFLLREREVLLLANEAASASKCKRKKRNENRSSSSSSAPHQAPSPPVAETTLQRPNGTTIAGEHGRKYPPPSSYKQTDEEVAKESPSATRETQKRKPDRPREESSVKTTLIRPDGNTVIQEPSPENSKQTKEQGAKGSATAKHENPKRKRGRPKKVKPQEDQDDAAKEPAPKRLRVPKPKAKKKPRAKKFSLSFRNRKDGFASCSSGNESEESEYVPGP